MLRLPDDPELLDELANVRLRESSPGVLRMDHDAGRHDDRAIALALASHRLVSRDERAVPMRLYRPGSGVPIDGREYEARDLAARLGPVVAGVGTTFSRARLRRHRSGPNALDRQLEEQYGIPRWSHERGVVELKEILDRARGDR
jgi:hypothetical protein